MIYRLSILSVIILSACTSNVRFSSDNNQNQKIVKSKKSNSQELNYNYKIDNNSLQSSLVEYSKDWLGVPYQYGGTTNNGIDCSAFVKNVYKNVGYELPRTAEEQFDFTKKVSRKLAKEGDLVFFKRRAKIFHVGIYLGNNQLIHASTSKGVIIQDLDDNWIKSNLYAFGRIPL